MNKCKHLANIIDVKPQAKGCVDCLKTGDEWVHLRLCLSCGNVGCCESSKNKHAKKHFKRVNHSVIKSFEKGEDWIYCYADKIYIEE